MGITFKHRGDFSKGTNFFIKTKKAAKNIKCLEKYAKQGVEALSSATPVDSGATASAWSYEIIQNGSGIIIGFNNSNINKGVNIAIILQYGHGTGTGGWVQGRDYINPAIQPIFDRLADEAWREVTSV